MIKTAAVQTVFKEPMVFHPASEEMAYRLFAFSNFGGLPDNANQDRLRRKRWDAMIDGDTLEGFEMDWGRDHYRAMATYAIAATK